MKKRWVILCSAAMLILAVATYVAWESRESEPAAGTPSAAAEGARTHSADEIAPPEPVESNIDAARDVRGDRGTSWFLADVIRDGALTDFALLEGAIGYVDVQSIVRDRDPFSVLTLLKQHAESTGANEALEIRITSVSQLSDGAYSADYQQFIGGIPTQEPLGWVNFDSSGVVSNAGGRILDARLARPDQIVILQHEAEAIAREAATQIEASRGGLNGAQGNDFRVKSYPIALRYANNPGAGNALRAEWVIQVAIPSDGIEFLIDAATGEVVDSYSMTSIKKAGYFAAPASCSSVNFRVCEGSKASGYGCDRDTDDDGEADNDVCLIYENGACPPDESDSEQGDSDCEPDSSDCGLAKYKRPSEVAYKAIAYVQDRGKDYLGHVKSILGRSGCTIDIMVGYHDELPIGTLAIWREPENVIIVSESVATNTGVIAHEVFHAVTQTNDNRQTGVEEGLVRAMEELYSDVSDWEWEGRPEDREKLSGHPLDDGVFEAIYRIYYGMDERDRNEVFQLILETDKRLPASPSAGDFTRVIVVALGQISASDELRDSVAAVLADMHVRHSNFSGISYTMKLFFWQRWEYVSEFFEEPDWADEIGELLDDWWETVKDDNKMQSE